MRLSALVRLKWLLASAGPAVLALPAFAVVAPLASVGTAGAAPPPAYVSADRSGSTTGNDGPRLGLSVDAAVKVEIERAGGVALADGSTCPTSSLRLSYENPGDGWSSGAYIDPLGPEPDADTTAVNGVVLCDGSHHAFVGFEASLDDG